MAYDPNDPADKKILEDAIAEATSGLTSKRDELLTEVKTLKAQIRKGVADPATLDRLEAELDAAKTALETTKTELKTVTKDRDKAAKGLETESAYTRNLLIDNGLTSSLTAAKVATQFLPAVKAMFSGKVEIKADGGERKAFIGDKPLADAITAWSQSDEGKHYVSAGQNGGGGAGGGGANSNGKSVSRVAFDAMPHAERGSFFATGGTVTE